MRELGPDVPLHFTAFHPDYKMTDIAPTPAATLKRARADRARRRACATSTPATCTTAKAARPSARRAASRVIVRDWYEILAYAVTSEGRCTHCGALVPGRYERFSRPWGRKRVPVRVGVAV